MGEASYPEGELTRGGSSVSGESCHVGELTRGRVVLGRVVLRANSLAFSKSHLYGFHRVRS